MEKAGGNSAVLYAPAEFSFFFLNSSLLSLVETEKGVLMAYLLLIFLL